VGQKKEHFLKFVTSLFDDIERHYMYSNILSFIMSKNVFSMSVSLNIYCTISVKQSCLLIYILTSLVIKDLVYEAKAKTFFSRPRT